MGLFSMSAEECNYFNDDCGYIELVSCPAGGKSCPKHLDFINERMKLSRTYWINKDFPLAIEELKMAYDKTAELNSPVCMPCVELFRSTIIKSLGIIQKDFQPRPRFIKRKSYLPDYELVTTALAEFAK